MIHAAFLALLTTSGAPERALEPIPIERVRLSHEFFVKRLEANTRVTIPHVLAQCEASGRLHNFAAAAAGEMGAHRGLPSGDAEVYKALEAIGWTLVSLEDAALEARADALIESVVAAQRPDGYLNTYVQLMPGKERWADLAQGHELYCAGHLIEAGIAYARGTGKTKLLDAALRFARLVEEEFAPGRREGVCGHPQIELALAKLHEHTGEARWIQLAKRFIDRRGDPARAERLGERAQDHAPIRAQRAVVGQAVGAATLFAGAADVAMLAPDPSLVGPLKTLWDDAFGSKTYLTGGLGGSAANADLAASFELPNATSRCETCAGIALAQWSQRMLLLTGDSKYADAVEQILYNHLPAATNLAGDRFFQDQPLESDGAQRREPWFASACCPANVARFWPQVPGLIFAQKGNTLYQAQLASAEVEVELSGAQVRWRGKADLPNSGRYEATVSADKPGTWSFKLRKPGWNVEAKVRCDLKEAEHDLRENDRSGGWATFERAYEVSDGLMAHFLAPVRRIKADERVAANRGRVALARGPVVYCLEGVDHGGDARGVYLPPDAEIRVENAGTILGGTRVIRARAKRVAAGGEIKVATLTAIPFWMWGNRDAGDMVVWIAESAEGARAPGQ
ncbi:MAG: glycoside hydrolase family 127 protein [Planctomycetes bacterium]|nr:glycoside hydrolase family 127 protein [Planctomycetota bacterium]